MRSTKRTTKYVERTQSDKPRKMPSREHEFQSEEAQCVGRHRMKLVPKEVLFCFEPQRKSLVSQGEHLRMGWKLEEKELTDAPKPHAENRAEKGLSDAQALILLCNYQRMYLTKLR